MSSRLSKAIDGQACGFFGLARAWLRLRPGRRLRSFPVQAVPGVLAAGGAVPHGPPTGIPGHQGAMASAVNDDEPAASADELERLKQEHRDLDGAIDALELSVAGDQLQIQRLKKRKLSLRDRISYIEDQITPDIIA